MIFPEKAVFVTKQIKVYFNIDLYFKPADKVRLKFCLNIRQNKKKFKKFFKKLFTNANNCDIIVNVIKIILSEVTIMNKTFKIPEVKIEELRKLMNRIQKKCAKYNNEFHFAEVGETIEEVTTETGKKLMVKFILVEASGTAIINDWEFIASVDHTTEGNIINKGYIEIAVPERYYTSNPICEHCGSNRSRKETYIVHNTVTDEFKQVGRSCLKDYTNGMDAAHVSTLLESLSYLEESETCNWGSYSNIPTYYEPKKYLQYAIETIKHFDYVKSDCTDSTRGRTDEFFYLLEDNWAFSQEYRERLRNEITTIKYNPLSEENNQLADKILAWLFANEDNSEYIHNLKTIFKSEYTRARYFGYIASLVATYNKANEIDAARKQEAEINAKSAFQGQVGDKISIEISDAQIVTSWSTQWGTTYIYKFVDVNGNVFTWKTSGGFDLDKKPIKNITGTVKAHNEYRGVQQTELTRCKVA